MKIFIFVLFTLLSANVSAGPYVDFGIGYVQSIPGESNTVLELNGTVIVQVNQKKPVEIDSPFLTVRFGYKFDPSNIHLEYNRFGLLDSDTTSVSSMRLYKRFESSTTGFYADLGGGFVLDMPKKTKTKTESEPGLVYTATATATIDLNEIFPMVRFGYNWRSTNIHLEYERIGKLFDEHESISTINVYKRWEWN